MSFPFEVPIDHFTHTHVEKVGEDGTIIITHNYNYTVF